MKLRILLSVLAFVVVSAACGKSTTEHLVGAQGQPGADGQDGVGCSDEPFAPNEEYPAGGIVITCGDDDPIILTNGADAPRYKKPKKPKKD